MAKYFTQNGDIVAPKDDRVQQTNEACFANSIMATIILTSEFAMCHLKSKGVEVYKPTLQESEESYISRLLDDLSTNPNQ